MNVTVVTEPSTLAQEPILSAELVADKPDKINSVVDFDIGTFSERRVSVSDEIKCNLLKRLFKPNRDYFFPVCHRLKKKEVSS